MYRVEIARTARRDLDRISGKDLSRIEEHVIGLEANPRPVGVKKLRDFLHRIRVGDWRVLYAIEDGKKLVTILRVLRRNEGTYRNV
ncbi:MAG: type II toxin-antitoxin system RelE/ParE family toxin [Elusimicrobia bacterium]|nr:type II toxin-antitoxin system RelE/ParE family toxin [Elusimicrobiota bacterium]